MFSSCKVASHLPHFRDAGRSHMWSETKDSASVTAGVATGVSAFILVCDRRGPEGDPLSRSKIRNRLLLSHHLPTNRTASSHAGLRHSETSADWVHWEGRVAVGTEGKALGGGVSQPHVKMTPRGHAGSAALHGGGGSRSLLAPGACRGPRSQGPPPLLRHLAVTGCCSGGPR